MISVKLGGSSFAISDGRLGLDKCERCEREHVQELRMESLSCKDPARGSEQINLIDCKFLKIKISLPI